MKKLVKILITLIVLMTFSTSIFAWDFAQWGKKFTIGNQDYLCFDLAGVKNLAITELDKKECLKKKRLLTIEVEKFNELCKVKSSEIKNLEVQLTLCKDDNNALQSEYNDLNKKYIHTHRWLTIYKYGFIISLTSVVTVILLESGHR